MLIEEGDSSCPPVKWNVSIIGGENILVLSALAEESHDEVPWYERFGRTVRVMVSTLRWMSRVGSEEVGKGERVMGESS